MAKKFRRMLAMVMVLCMVLSALPMQALAAEDGTVTETQENDGVTTEITTTTTTSTNSDTGNVTVTVEFESTSSGTNSAGEEVSGTASGTSTTVTDTSNQIVESSSSSESTTTTTSENTETGASSTSTTVVETKDELTSDGVSTDYDQTSTKTIVVEADGTTKETSTVDGTEKKEWTEDVEVGQEVPSVTVKVDPGQTTKGEASDDEVEEPVDNLKDEGGSTDKKFDWTTVITITDREVTVEAEEIEKNSVSGDVNLEPVAPDTMTKEDGTIVQGYYADGTPKKDIAVREDYFNRHIAYVEEITDPETGEVTYKLYNYIEKVDGETQMHNREGEEAIWDANGNSINFDGNWNGDYIYSGWGDYFPGQYVETDGMDAEPIQLVLRDKDNNLVYAYCVDLETSAIGGSFYNVANLEDGTYYADPESESHIRAIVKNGYWGTSNDKDAETNTYKTGSLAKIKDDLANAFADPNNPLTDKDVTVDGTTMKLSELMQGLTEGEAMVVTQAAIWSWSNGAKSVNEGSTGKKVIGVGGWSGPGNHDRMDTLYTYLMSLTEEAQSESTVIDDTSFLEEDGMSLVIGEKVAEAGDEIDGETLENDVYDVGLNFKLAFAVSEKDELIVYLIDNEGNPIKDKDGNSIVKNLAPKGAEAKEGYIMPADDGSYTLTGLRLAENSDFTFDLKLEGTQYLEQGVYVYSPVGGRDSSQTMIGMGEGTREVEVSTSLTVSFSVDESNKVVAERVWHNESDPVITPAEKPEEDPREYPTMLLNEEPAPQVFRLNNQDNLVEIPEEPVPLATPVVTGDNSNLWIAVILMSVLCMVAINVFDKKKQHETF